MTGHKIPVFVGPSLDRGDRQGDEFDWRPPAQAGDLLALIERPPPRVCLIDGLFDRCAAPWHKEILLLMAAGTQVLGAASMGALRACELDRFGMVGVGVIYQAYRGGRLVGDDEVALVHATARLGWAPLSVPMVEMRATLVRGCRAGLLSPRLARRLRQHLHAIHYEERDWPAMEDRCLDLGLGDRASFRAIAAGHVRLKRSDALSCLRVARSAEIARPAAVPPPPTVFIRRLAREIGVEPALDRALRGAR